MTGNIKAERVANAFESLLFGKDAVGGRPQPLLEHASCGSASK